MNLPGALDTATSVQIMEILKNISKDKLIIMVTHNPELAEKYSSRVIRVLDGKVTSDSNPYKRDEEKEPKKKAKTGKTSMNFFTALSLSLNNLMTKKGRTILTSFAGSIGIIGIALILSLSNGVQNYINKVQEDTLSSYPITIEESTIDMASMLEVMMDEGTDNKNHEDGKIYSKDVMNEMISTLSNKIQTNNLEEFKKYIEEEGNEIKKNSSAIQYTYNLNINLYKEDTTNGIVKVNPSTVMNSMGMGNMIEEQNSSPMASSSMMVSQTDVWEEMLDNEDLLKSQYDIVAGNWPKSYNEVALVVDKDNQISDYTLYSLGLKDQKELEKKWNAVKRGDKVEADKQTVYTYEDLLNLSFKLVLNTDYYEKSNNMWVDKSDDEEYMKKKIADAENIKISCIIKPNEESVATSVSGAIGYTKELKEYVINKINEQEIVKEQKQKPEVNIFTGINFPKENEIAKFDYSNLTQEQKAYMSSLSSEEMAKLMQSFTKNQKATYEDNLETLGVVNLEKPSGINIYGVNFDAKELIADEIEKYNQKQRDEGKEANVINYTDMVGMMMKSVSVIVNMISYVLIAFVAISLIVSSIMIGIITYISVLERTKEIGILRAIGASKKDISRVFNAETFIIGLASGLLGIGITALLTIPVNAIIKLVANVSGIASLPIGGAVILVMISMILTIIAGLIPSKMASKKDPVEALRTE